MDVDPNESLDVDQMSSNGRDEIIRKRNVIKAVYIKHHTKFAIQIVDYFRDQISQLAISIKREFNLVRSTIMAALNRSLNIMFSRYCSLDDKLDQLGLFYGKIIDRSDYRLTVTDINQGFRSINKSKFNNRQKMKIHAILYLIVGGNGMKPPYINEDDGRLEFEDTTSGLIISVSL